MSSPSASFQIKPVRDMAEAEAVCLKQEPGKTLQQGSVAEEKLIYLDSELKKCIREFGHVQGEQEARVHDAVMEMRKESEKAQKKLKEKLTDTSRRLESLIVENAHLTETLQVKERLIEDLIKSKYQADSEFCALISRLDSIEKENSFLRYEFQMLEKEVEIRNEEREFTHRSMEASQKQQLESVKKIGKLEGECQRLRLLLRKRLPGPVALGKIRNEVTEMTRKKLTHVTGDLVVRDSFLKKSHEIPGFLIERLLELEGENKRLEESVIEKTNELQFLSNMRARTAMSESELGDLARCSPISNGRSRSIGVSDMRLMYDFVEMEKLALFSMDGTVYGSTSLANSAFSEDRTGKELVPVAHGDDHSSSDLKPEVKLKYLQPKDWLQDVLKTILDQNRTSKRSLEDLIEDIKIGVASVNRLSASDVEAVAMENPSESKPLPLSEYLAWRPANTPQTLDSASPLSLSESIGRITELIEEILYMEKHDTENTVHIFQWKSSEIHALLREFFLDCNNLLKGEINFEKFTEGLSSTLDWAVKKCITSSNERDGLFPRDKIQQDLEDETGEFKDEGKYEAPERQNLEASYKNNALKRELESLKESRRAIEDQVENHKLTNEDLNTQLTVAKMKVNEVLQNLSSMEAELEDKSNYCEELEAMCLDLHLQLESAKKSGENEETPLQTGMAVTAASVKLAECQETILNVEKQLKALASPRDTALFDKVFSSAATLTGYQNSGSHATLLYQMNAEDNDYVKTSPKIKEITSTAYTKKESGDRDASVSPTHVEQSSRASASLNRRSGHGEAGPLAVVPSKKQGGNSGFLRKLLLRRKRGK